MIQVGETIPNVILKTMGSEGPVEISTEEIFANKKVVLFAVPGAFTPTCSVAHLPGFVVQADAIKAKGVDTIVCMAVNDVFVMNAWGKANNAEELLMIADGNADLTEAMGLDIDATGWGMGAVRSKRFALIANDGVIEALEIDEKGLEKSSAEYVLSLL